jgi:hypothetical protein
MIRLHIHQPQPSSASPESHCRGMVEKKNQKMANGYMRNRIDRVLQDGGIIRGGLWRLRRLGLGGGGF